MKDKKNIYILLVFVLLIWGTAIYQFFSFSNDEVFENTRNENILIKPLVLKPKDTFSIVVNNRDVFLGKIIDNKIPVSKKAKSKVLKPIEKEVLIWPQIQYKGVVSDNTEKTKIYMLRIDNKTFLMKRGTTQNGIFLKDGDRETVELVYKKQPKLFFIQ